jgi:RNA polymerase sigma-70 factor (ECF subfamily)
LQRALLKLSEDKREVLLLSRFQDMSYKEIAQLLGCDVGTIKTRVFRAIRELRQIVADWESESSPRSRTRGAYEM